jgi:hypothetical protein
MMRTTGSIVLLAAALGGLLSAARPVEGEPAAGPPALVSLERAGWGGYGGPHFRATTLNGRFALYGGGPILLYPTERLGLGVSFCLPEGDAAGLWLGYGGLRAEYVLRTAGRIHPVVGLLAGGGVARYRDPDVTGGPAWQTGGAVLEPEALVRFDLFGGFRLAAGGAYRLALGFGGLPGIEPAGLSGPVGVVQLEYGWFPGDAPAGAPAPAREASAGRGERGPRRLTTAGAWSFKLTTLGGQLGVLDGGGTRLLLLDRRLFLGVGGYFSHEGPELGGDLIGCGYGGLWAEYDFRPQSPVHLSLGASYRFAFLLDPPPELDSRDFCGPSAVFQLRFVAR